MKNKALVHAFSDQRTNLESLMIVCFWLIATAQKIALEIFSPLANTAYFFDMPYLMTSALCLIIVVFSHIYISITMKKVQTKEKAGYLD